VPVFVLWVAVVAVVLFAVAAVALGRGDAMVPARPDRRPLRLPEQDLVPADLQALRLGVGFRGYRMDEVDLVLDRVERELACRDARLAELEARLAARDEAPPEGDASPTGEG
jgi:DivIVA domain-containing protein